jgi:hypothetical protein
MDARTKWPSGSLVFERKIITRRVVIDTSMGCKPIRAYNLGV